MEFNFTLLSCYMMMMLQTARQMMDMAHGAGKTVMNVAQGAGETVMNMAQGTGQSIMNVAHGVMETVKNSLGAGEKRNLNSYVFSSLFCNCIHVIII